MIFTFGMLLLCRKAPFALLIIPALWAVLGFTAVMNFGVYQDIALLLSALVAVPMILLRYRKS